MGLYLVTGGAGFIGSHLSASLAADGHRVRVLDDLSTGKRERLPAVGAELWEGDVADPQTVLEAAAGVDGIFHLAALSSVPVCNGDWPRTTQVNTGGTVNVLQAARRDGAPVPVVYASSAAVYGDSEHPVQMESHAVVPRTPYGASKHACESYAGAVGLSHGIPSVGFRIFNVYGPGQDPSSPYSGVISIFADRLRRGEGLTIYGDGQQRRDFVYVGDVVQAMRRAIEAAAPGVVSNIATGRSVTLLQLAKTLAELVDTPLELAFEPARTGDIRSSCGSPQRMQQLFGVSAATTLEQGLSALLRGG